MLKALAMPRVSLLLADGVGLGKTIQSGLVLEELLLRRRIRRILVVCPAMLQRQWKYELRRKFNLEFEVIDSDSTFQLRRRLGIDTNPWKAFPRIITSMDYLRMPDVLQQFLQASGAGPDAESNGGRTSPHAPWDLLIVDECHHFAPQSGSGPASAPGCCGKSAFSSSIASSPRPRRTTARPSASPACSKSSTSRAFRYPSRCTRRRPSGASGSGFHWLADALVMCGLRYGSRDAVTATETWLGLIEREAYLASAALAAEKGP